MRTFVTGATGLLGNNLVRCLADAGHDVVALVRDPAKAARVLAGTGARIVVGDMLRVGAFADHLRGCDAVFHTAAYFREAFEPGPDGAALEAVNVGGTISLLDAADAARVGCFVHVGSGGVIGRKADGSPGDEATPPLPIEQANPYFRSKLEGDAAIAAWRRTGDIAIVEILPGWIWGPWDAAPTGAGRLVAEFTSGRIPASTGGGTSVVDARDVAGAMIAAARRAVAHPRDEHLPAPGTTPPVEKFIVGGRYCSMQEIMQHLQAATGVQAPRFEVPLLALLAYAHGCETWGKWTGGAPLITPFAVRTLHSKITLDSSKAERELGVRFREVAETFRDAVEWQQRHARRR